MYPAAREGPRRWGRLAEALRAPPSSRVAATGCCAHTQNGWVQVATVLGRRSAPQVKRAPRGRGRRDRNPPGNTKGRDRMKTYRSRWGWMVPVVLALTLTACGPASAPANTVTPAATASPMPTVTTAPTVSPAPTASTVSTASPAPTASSTVAAQSYADPFAYCAAVGAVDKPDARYTGAPITDEVINGYLAAAGLQNSTEPMDMLRKTTIWRCMGGKVRSEERRVG